MTFKYWNEYMAGRTWFARPVTQGQDRVWLIPTHRADGTPLPQDFLEAAGEVGVSFPLEEIK
jgi:hypothetical protein